jgi:hypothetical protein
VLLKELLGFFVAIVLFLQGVCSTVWDRLGTVGVWLVGRELEGEGD